MKRLRMMTRKRLYITSLVFFSLLNVFNTGIVSALTQDDLNSIVGYTPFYDPDAIACGASGSIVLASTMTTALDADQQADAQTIIGIAKTDNLGQAGALIGLMVGLDESHLLNLANENVPISESNPNKQGDGSNGTSLGIFQQQIQDNWSTISSDPNDEAAVNQLMTPSYAAEAFFGSPSGSNANSALTKGLQDVSNWQALQPWVAAQDVQHSGTSDGSNYEAWLNDAQSLITKYWSGAAAIPLPVSFSDSGSSSSTETTAISSCTASTQCSNGAAGDAKILCAAQAWTGVWYEWGGGHQGRSAFVASCPDPSNAPDNQATGGAGGGNPSPCAVDCSGLVSMAVDAAFDQSFDWVVADITQDPADWKEVPISQAQPGDVVTEGTDHVEIFVSYNASNGSVNTFGAHQTGTQDGTGSAVNGFYDAAWQYIGPGSN